MASKLLQAVLGHHATGLPKPLAAPIELTPSELEPEASTRRLEDPLTLGHDLVADSVAGDHRDAMAHTSPFITLYWRPPRGRDRAVTGPSVSRGLGPVNATPDQMGSESDFPTSCAGDSRT